MLPVSYSGPALIASGGCRSSVAQLAEHPTVNRTVTGSSPVGGAKAQVIDLGLRRLTRSVARELSQIEGVWIGMFRILLGTAFGYILGSRAGRERYEQIKRWSARAVDHPAVQGAAGFVRAKISQTLHLS